LARKIRPIRPLTPVTFDIETSGLDTTAEITAAGFALELGSWLVLNTGGRDGDAAALEQALDNQTEREVQVAVRESEAALLDAVGEFVDERLDDDAHYLTAYNGETWNGGFDLPFVRRSWPFSGLAYADVFSVLDGFETDGMSDLAGVYEQLIGSDCGDPFEESGAAVGAYERGAWEELLAHNLADIERTRELALVAERYIAGSDFGMKNLTPPATNE
jgi:hypothetical protein